MNQGQNIVELENEHLRLRVCPEVGATITAFSLRKNDTWLDLMRRAPEPLEKSSHGSFIMLPYSNRIRNALFTWKNERYQLDKIEKHAIHGDVRDRAWSISSQSQQQVVMEIDSQNFPDFNFPFPIAAEVSYAIEETKLQISLSVKNNSESEIPLGFGLHPYFNTSLGETGETAKLQFSAQGYYPYEGDLPLPESGRVQIPEHFSFERPREIVSGIDHCYGGWNGKACISWPKSKVELRFECDKILRHAILYTPPNENFFAFEPASMSTDGFNAISREEENTGVQIIEAGESLTTICSLYASNNSVSP
jgi:aldose 1-epimerase